MKLDYEDMIHPTIAKTVEEKIRVIKTKVTVWQDPPIEEYYYSTKKIIAMFEAIVAHLQTERDEVQLWQHYKGDIYEFMGDGQDEAEGHDVAIYKSTVNGQIWVRPMTEFKEKFTPI